MRPTCLHPLVFAVCLVVAGHPRVAAAEAPRPAEPGPATVAELQTQLLARVEDPRFRDALWGLKVMSLDTGRVLFEHHADRLLSPASNSKLYTAALALDHFGGEYRIVTPLLAAAPPDADGTLRGDLIVSGRGDPGWKAARRGEDFGAIFNPFLERLRKAGVRRITGDVVADATWFRGPPTGAGWTVDDLNDDYGAEISALSLENNFADLRVAPAARVGEPCELRFLQPHTGLVLENRTTTAAAGTTSQVEVRRLLGEQTVYVFGQVPVGSTAEIIDVTVPRPAQWLAEALRAALIRGGIAVEGRARSVRWPEPSAVPPGAVTVATIASAPLRELVAAFNKPSQNLETDLIFAHVGEALRAAEAPARRTSEQSAVLALDGFLRRNGLPADEVRFEEGSGLSRNNLTTANATAALLAFMAEHREAKNFAASLPVAGVDGTLRRRMKDTPAEGNVRAKTGTLRWATALSGYVTSAAGERLVFSAMLNRHVVPAGRSRSEEVDWIAVRLAGLTGRSDDVPVERAGRLR